MDALDVLRPAPTLRERALQCIKDPFVHGALDAFDRLNDRVKAEQASSTVSRLEMFVCDETVRTVICSPQSLDLEHLLTERKIILVNFAKYQPLLPDTLKLLGRMLFNDLLAHIYKGHGEGSFDENRPCYVICDEVQNFATTTLCDALDEGRGIGFHSVIAHQHLSQLADEDKSGYLLRSVMNDARTKIIFGDLDYDDLECLSRNVMLDRYSPWALKDELTSPVFVPVETTRVSRSVSRSKSRGQGLSLPESETEGTSASTSHGTSQSMTIGIQESQSASQTRGKSKGRPFAVGMSETDVDSWAETDAEGEHWAEGDSNAESWAESSAMSLGESVGMGQGMVTTPDGDELTMTSHEISGTSAAFVSGTSAGGSRRACIIARGQQDARFGARRRPRDNTFGQ
jgi:TraM recognition site of TraD and TraG